MEIKSASIMNDSLLRGLDYLKTIAPAAGHYIVYGGNESLTRTKTALRG